MRRLDRNISLLGERHSWSSLGSTELSKLTVLYETKVNPFILNQAHPYFYHIMLAAGGFILFKIDDNSTRLSQFNISLYEKVWVCSVVPVQKYRGYHYLQTLTKV